MFSEVISFPVDYVPDCKLTKWVSKRTGLQLIHIDYKSSPLVQGYFALATECPNDSGAPHTLEHLVFMGSKQYPYKGLLDTAGNLCMSSTNAWTATDHTAYSLTTAGWEGFAKLLPVYLDHVLFPTLTDDACVTEVHHIDPENLSDKGVVYSEMDAIENQSWFITNLAMQRLVHPNGSGYRSETGGLTHQLRDLTNEQIRQFHKDMYSSDNLCLIITGNLDSQELLNIVQQWDDTLTAKVDEQRRRPFIDTPLSQIPASNTTLQETSVEFPELDESQGEVMLTWIGESYFDYVNDLAVTILMEYFTETAVAPFTKQLVEIDDPLATSVEYWTDDYMRTIVNISMRGVPTDSLEEAKLKLLEILASHQIDLTRMKQVIDTAKWEYIIRSEKAPENTILNTCITDFLYGNNDGSSLRASVATLSDYTLLMDWNVDQWQALLDRVFIANKPHIVVGRPSATLYEQIEKDNELLLKERENKLTPEERKKILDLLTNAKLHNDIKIPKSILTGFEIENPTTCVNFTKTKSVTPLPEYQFNDTNDNLTKELITMKPQDFPMFIHLEHFHAQFIEFHCILNTAVIKDETLLPFFHVFDRLFSMPMLLDNGEILPFEDVVSKLNSETVDAQISLGVQGTFPDLIDIRVRCKCEEYSQAVDWVKHVLFDMHFDETRVSVLLENYLNSIVELKREGDVMLQSITNRNLFTERSIQKSADPLFVEDTLKQILDDIKDGKFENCILPKLETMRSHLRRQFDKFHLLVLGDMEKIKSELYTAWGPLIKQIGTTEEQHLTRIPVTPKPLNSISDICKNPSQRAFIITTPGSESSYMKTVTKVPFDLDYYHPDYAAVSLASEYLQCVEGPFWNGIRGSGLAYGANMIKKPEINTWEFSVYRGADVIKCYETGRATVENFANGVEAFDRQLIMGALSSIINTIASIENGYLATGISKFIDEFILERGTKFTEDYLRRLSEVTVEDLQRVMKQYLINLFDSEKSVVFVSCHPSKLESIQEFLEGEGFTIELEELEDDEDEDVSSSDED
ncbi:Sdd3p KNAG_0K00690 [Huiozyma naganishii CBS 8797]|uniref:Mitochondrial presequence protease n=1 Tax=Huiozyma naganishii (strain ATCC MYA-139 / BCRC 22969 / CBS 8797 / KCTC 17520 / NBRC 10181 / NCYC 3082 / Yp74L-3) TaxID=1071383 RepID=J7S361_HUIN7|nr:hypothetical protein KNAG_0K00690 [Kazachstania naganishii CBS 8797]CCK72437.1 hypothetical protein KNAG_0K00690 [Kazachstania naganishii CBS 8797]